MNNLLAGAILFSLGLVTGWWVNGLRHDSIALSAERAAHQVLQAERARESQVAQIVEIRLQELKANERTIHTREVEVVERPVYRTDCIDADGLRIINAYGSGDPAEPTR